MRAFVLMKKYISKNLLEQRYINNQVLKNTEDIKLLKESISKFEEKRKDNEIFKSSKKDSTGILLLIKIIYTTVGQV